MVNRRMNAEVAEVKKGQLRRYRKRFLISLGATVLLLIAAFALHAQAAPTPDVTIDLAVGNGTEGSLGLLELLFLLVVIALAPSILVMMTSFTRIIIVLSFLRNAMGIQQTPPNQVLIGMALFLTLFIMLPTLEEINTEAYEPYQARTITSEEAIERAGVPIKRFMLKQMGENDLSLFLSLAQARWRGEDGNPDPRTVVEEADGDPEKLTSLPLAIVVPAFITSELRRAFEIGFLLFLPFLIIDMVVSSTLMSMGMVMLPPSMISLPFKLMLFVLVDGWGLLFETLINGFLV